MIFYLDEEVNWKHGRSDIDMQVKKEMEKIQAKYFSPNTLGKVTLIYPKGRPEGDFRTFGVLKKFPIELTSPDGVWRYSKSRPRIKNGQREYDDHHRFVTWKTFYTEKDIEFVWFLEYKSSAVRSGRIVIENLEEEAKKQIEVMSSDADIKYMIMGKTSPIAKDKTLIKQAADIFGVKDVERRSIDEVRLDLYNTILDGQKRKDRFINFEKFEELTEGNQKRKAAFVARRAIQDGIVGYKDRAMWLKEGREYAEKLMGLKSDEIEDRNEVFIQEVINNPNIKSRLFAAMGEDESYNLDDLRELDRPTLMRMANDRGLTTTNSDKKEDLLKKLCEDMELEYQPKSA